MTTQSLPCLICGKPLNVRLAHGRKSGKAFVFLVCAADGRHFRAFISHRPYVQELLGRLGSAENPAEGTKP